MKNRTLRPFGYLSIIKTPANIIWDDDSAELHIAGFSTAISVDLTQEWNDDIYEMYHLVKGPRFDREDPTRWEW